MYLGVDMGGTTVKIGVVNRLYRIVYTTSVKTNKKLSARQFADEIINEINLIKEKYPLDCMGIGASGDVNYKEGFIGDSKNLPFNNNPIAEWFEKGTGLKTLIDNDANCAALGEFLRGTSKMFKNIVLLTIGTGIGGGIIIDRKIFHGRTGRAGEIGHTTIDMNGPECYCGNRGCFELYASATALIEQTDKAAKENPDSILSKCIKQDGLNGKTAFDAFYTWNCPVAEKVIDNYTHYLSLGIDDITNILEPDAIILAGGISKSGDQLLDPLKKKLRFKTPVFISTLQNNAGMIGAALLHKYGK